jgi:sugar phosphate isomerase/epimerase
MNDADVRRIAIEFFRELGDYAVAHGTVVGIEANPAIYGTNFVNRTEEALSLIEDVASDGVRLNLDVGTMIANDEFVDGLRGKVHLVNHVHVSEPYLKAIQHRSIHAELLSMLSENGYAGFVSIEMGKVDDLEEIKKAMLYVKEMV